MEFEAMARKSKTNGNGNGQHIKRVLRHKNSKKYFKDGGWTRNPKEASGFSDVVEAAQICIRYDLSNVELALQFESGACDVFCTSIR
jgi:hypothetical protein